MEFVNYLKSFFSCLYLKRRKTKNEASTDPPPPKLTVVELRREKIKRISSLQTSWGYRQKQGRILKPISFSYKNIVVVWCRGVYVPTNVNFTSTLHSFGDISFIRDRWSNSVRFGYRIWRGAIVEFANKRTAIKASFDLPLQMSYTRVTMLQTILTHLADCELLHPQCHSGNFKVVIYRRIPFCMEEMTELHSLLCLYGTVETFFVNNRISSLGVVCEVTYPYLTQAYLAKIMIDGQYFHGEIIAATIEETKKSSDIIRDTKECMMLLSQCYFSN